MSKLELNMDDMMSMTVAELIADGMVPSLDWLETMVRENNIIGMTDSYKYTHWSMLLPGTQKVSSYQEARVGAKYNKTVFVDRKSVV